jgi:tetratricopeptide (TPR) repeat protein
MRSDPRSVWLVGAVLLVAMVAIIAVPTFAQTITDLERDARRLFDQERYAEAVEVLQSILKEQPDNRTANILLSFALARLDRAPEAVEQTRRALGLFPTNIKLELLLAGLLAQQEATRPDAIRRYQQVLRRDPDNPLAQLGLAETFRVQGQVYDALGGFARLAKAAPDDARYAVRLGQSYATLGDLRESRRQFEHALSLSPDNLDAVRSLAILADVEDRPWEAMRYYRKLQALLPADVSIQIALREEEERMAEPRFPMPLEQMETIPLEQYTSAVPTNSKQLQQRKEQLASLQLRSYTRFLPSLFVAPSNSTTTRQVAPDSTAHTKDETSSLSFSIGWNIADIFSNPFRPSIVGLEADFQAILSNLLADVTATYYQRLQQILEYRRLQRAIALSPLNAQLRQSKQTTKYSILNLTERLRLITGLP